MKKKAKKQYGIKSEKRSSGLRVRERPRGDYEVEVPASMTANGKKRRKICRTKEDADSYAESVEEGLGELGRQFFRLNEVEMYDCLQALPRAREVGLTIGEAVDFAIPRLRPHGGSKRVKELIREMTERKEERLLRGDLRAASMQDWRYRSGVVKKQFGDRWVHDLRLEEITEWVRGLEGSDHLRGKMFGAINEVFAEAVRRRVLHENPVESLEMSEKRELFGTARYASPPEVVHPSVVKRILEGTLVDDEMERLTAPLALGFFCGLRTGEILRLDWSAIHLDEAFLTVGREIAKTGQIRTVDIPENCEGWLRMREQPGGPVYAEAYPREFYRAYGRLMKSLDLLDVPRNAMRHTFASCLYQTTGDESYVQSQMGHTEDSATLLQYYRALVRPKDARAHFSIWPEGGIREMVKKNSLPDAETGEGEGQMSLTST